MIPSLLLEFTFPSGSDANAFNHLITEFSTWICRIGGLIMFFGAVKFALAIKEGDPKDKTLALLTFVAGAIIIDVATKSSSNYLFTIPSNFDEATAKLKFDNLTLFISKWVKRVGGFIAFVGGTEIAMSIRNNDAGAKVSGSYTLVTGAILIGTATLL